MKNILFLIIVMFALNINIQGQNKNSVLGASHSFVEKDITKDYTKKTIHKKEKNKVDLHWAKILNEGFETWPPANWGLYSLGDVNTTWEQGTDEANSGLACAFHNWTLDPHSNISNWIVTPALTIDNDIYQLNFWEYLDVGTYYYHKISILDNPDPTIANELEILYAQEGIHWEWTEKQFSLSAYNGQTIYIGFYYQGVSDDYNDRWYIDDVVVGYPAVNDLAVDTITPTWVMSGTSANPEVTVHNYGQVSETTWSVQLSDAAGYNETINNPGTINPDEEITVQFPDWSPPNGTYTLTASIIIDIDDAPENNTITNQCEVDERYFMADANIQTCSGRFFDSGGIDNDFGLNENYIMTFTPTQAESMISVDFTYFNCGTHSDRYLEIYNGSNTEAPLIISSLNVSSQDEMLQTFTANNIDGALTFHFVSSEYSPYPGWEANISCFSLPDYDLAVEKITPDLAEAGTTVTPQVEIISYGAANAGSWSITLTDGNSYNETIVNPTTLNFLDTVVVDFPNWIPQTGYYTLTADVQISGDANTDNNQLEINGLAHGGFSNYALAGNGNLETYYKINLPTGNLENIGTISYDPYPMAEEYAADGKMYRIYNNRLISTVNIYTGEETELGFVTGLAQTIPTGIAYNWEENQMYIMMVDETNSINHLGTLNLLTLEINEVGSLTDVGLIIAMDFANDGYIYAPALNKNKVYKINKTTLEAVELEPMGIQIGFGQDVTFDRQAELLLTITNQLDDTGVNWENKYGYYDLITGKFHEIQHIGDEQFATMSIYEGNFYNVNFVISNGTNQLENAIININQNQIQTNQSGIATIELINGSYPYTINLDGYENYSNSVTVNNANETLNIILNENVSVEEQNNQLYIYPNPTDGIVTINNNQQTIRNIKIFDITGKVIFNDNFSNFNSQQAINLTNQPAGMYFIRIQTDNSTINKRIVKK